MSNKILIAYFSRSGSNYAGGNTVNLLVGNTEFAAKKLQGLTGGDLFKIDSVNRYPADYKACTEQAKQELQRDARPELSIYLSSIEPYGTIILGFPNWWGTMPMPVWTFLTRYDFSGKTILPLCTHEGSGMGSSEADIRKLCPGSQVECGLAITGSRVAHADKKLEDWVKKSRIVN